MNNYTKIKELPLDQKTTTVVLLLSIEEKQTKTGGSYCRLSLTDGESKIDANLWNKEKYQVMVEEKSLITAELYPKMYNGAVSYELYHYGPAPDSCEIGDFVLRAPYEGEQMYNEILAILEKDLAGKDGNLIELVRAIYEENKEKLLYWSAAKAVHHNCYGGLLYHTLRMVKSGVILSRVYPFDRELLLCGIALHDIGKLEELETDSLGAADYSVDGTLYGHALIGIEMISEAAKKGAYNPEKIKMLKHMIASHHGNLDWGAITLPAIPEAMLLHEIDMIDSRMYQYEDAYKKLEGGEMSDRIFGLGTPVYKPNYEI